MIRLRLLGSLLASAAAIVASSTASADVTPDDRASGIAMVSQDNLGIAGPIDLDRWCQARYGPLARAVVKQPNAYGWVCFIEGRELPIDVADAARMQYGPSAKVACRDFNDAYSWYAYFD
jgi:hypothetical protein